MRITFVLPNFPEVPIGGYRVVYEYANRLASRGHRVSVVHPRRLALSSPKNPYRRVRRRARGILDRLFPPGVDWQPIDRRVSMLYVPDLRPRHVPDGDAVFATAWQTADHVLGFPCSKGVKFYLIQHYETWAGSKEQVDATWRAPLHKVVIAKWLLELGRELNCEDMQYIPNGIDHARYRLVSPIANRPKQVAMMYSVQEWKGSRDGLRALAIVKDGCPDLRAVLFGTPERPESMAEWIEYRQNPPQAELVNEIYNGSSIYLCASWTEGFSLPPAEAMACGCAVATTDCGGIREFAEDEVTALISPPRDSEAMARNIARLLEDNGLRQRLAKAGHDRVQSFTWERSTDQLEQLVRLQVGKAAED